MPLRSKADLLRLSVILRNLGTRFEILAGLGPSDDFTALLQAKIEGNAAQARMASRPKQGWRAVAPSPVGA